MNQVLLAAATVLSAAEEHGGEHHGTVWGMEPIVFGIIAAILFAAMFLVTISFSGRGIIRAEHATNHLGADEAQALADYKAKHNH